LLEKIKEESERTQNAPRMVKIFFCIMVN